MSIVATLMDKARQRRGIPTDMALAERLGRSRALVSEWRAGKGYPDEDLIIALAEMAGDDPGEWLVAVKAIRTDGRAGKVWAELAKRIGAAAVMLVVTVGAALPARAEMNEKAFQITPHAMHYAKLAHALAWAWHLLRLWLAHRLQRPKSSPKNMEASVCA